MIILKSCDICATELKPGQNNFPTSECLDRDLGAHHPMKIHDSIRLWAKVDTFSGSALVSGTSCKPDVCRDCFIVLLRSMVLKLERKSKRLAREGAQ